MVPVKETIAVLFYALPEKSRRWGKKSVQPNNRTGISNMNRGIVILGFINMKCVTHAVSIICRSAIQKLLLQVKLSKWQCCKDFVKIQQFCYVRRTKYQ
jgi:hypothetical protein